MVIIIICGGGTIIREVDDRHVCLVLAVAPLSAHIMNRNLQPHSQVQSVTEENMLYES